MDRTDFSTEHYSAEFVLQPDTIPIRPELQLKTRASTGSFTSILASRKTPLVEISGRSILSLSSHSSLALTPWYHRDIEDDGERQNSSTATPVIYPSRNPSRPFALNVARDELRSAGTLYLKRMEDARQRLRQVMGPGFEVLDEYVASIRASITENEANLDKKFPYLTHRHPSNHQRDPLAVATPTPLQSMEDPTKESPPKPKDIREDAILEAIDSKAKQDRITEKVLEKLASRPKQASPRKKHPPNPRGSTNPINATKPKDPKRKSLAPYPLTIADTQENTENSARRNPSRPSYPAQGVEQTDSPGIMPPQPPVDVSTYGENFYVPPFKSSNTLEGSDDRRLQPPTYSSQQTGRTYYQIPEDGSPITIPTRKKSSKLDKSTNDDQVSQTSLLIEYFSKETSIDSNIRPGMRVKVTPKNSEGDRPTKAPIDRRDLQTSDDTHEDTVAEIDGPRNQRSNSINPPNPKLLQTVEDAIRRLILPELKELKKDPQYLSSRSGDNTSSRRIPSYREHSPYRGVSSRRRRTQPSYESDNFSDSYLSG